MSVQSQGEGPWSIEPFQQSIFALAASLFAIAAGAAPFCVVTSFGKQCNYYDEPSCERAAASMRGGCVLNENEVRAPAPTGAPFCVVTSFATQCFYYDVPSCQRAAETSRGRCVARDR